MWLVHRVLRFCNHSECWRLPSSVDNIAVKQIATRFSELTSKERYQTISTANGVTFPASCSMGVNLALLQHIATAVAGKYNHCWKLCRIWSNSEMNIGWIGEMGYGGREAVGSTRWFVYHFRFLYVPWPYVVISFQIVAVSTQAHSLANPNHKISRTFHQSINVIPLVIPYNHKPFLSPLWATH